MKPPTLTVEEAFRVANLDPDQYQQLKPYLEHYISTHHRFNIPRIQTEETLEALGKLWRCRFAACSPPVEKIEN